MNEWEFTAEVAGWINLILARTGGGLPFSGCRCEQPSPGSRKRRDLTLLDKSQIPALTGEVKLPYQADGGTPYVQKVIEDARKKAQKAKAPFFFTWNVNEFVLWETNPTRQAWRNRCYRAWPVVNIMREADLTRNDILDAIQDWLVVMLNDFAKVLLGTTPIGATQPDEQFIDALESSLRMPINLNVEALRGLYRNASFRGTLDAWMREKQGWVIYDDPDGIEDNLDRAARFACYGLVNKLVFYEALLKRYGVKMSRLSIPKHVTTGENLRRHLERYFSDAKTITGDYETVFGETHLSVGNLIPFYADAAVDHWRQLIDQIHLFDFSQLDYEIIGSMCERLLSPEERHKYGMFYTRVEVVDLINSFCIRRGDELVMDPACGGGTFLVRAYARKRELSPGRKHDQLLAELFGVDISDHAARMTTMNLAVRDLVDAENYPQVARSDFFDVEHDKRFLSLPRKITAKGLGSGGHREVDVPQLDAVVGNPPYVRQEDIPKSPKKAKDPRPGTKEYYRKRVNKEAGASLSARSDIHCYFWPHAITFLKPDGHLCLITSSQWLDVEYGFRLQEWILRNFEIVAVLESVDEPWFVGARVATTVTILRRQGDQDRRMNNLVRFVQFRRPIAEILAHDKTTAGAVMAADEFRDEILGLKGNSINGRYRARLVRQGSLWSDGVRLGTLMGKSIGTPCGDDSEDGETEPSNDLPTGEYYGGKWGVFLRAPDLWFRLIDQYSAGLMPLADMADVRFGVKSGKDEFFLPKDHSQKCLDETPDFSEFQTAFGVPRRLVETGRVKLVACGKGLGEVRPIETEYLEPEIHSLMEVDRFTVRAEGCSRMILLVGKTRDELRGTYVLDYIHWGEKQGFHRNPTCAARATDGREWYDLTFHKRPDIVLPKIQQYRLIAFLDPSSLYQNSSLLGIYDVPPALRSHLAGVLNSTVAILSRLVYARILGNEGNIQLDVYSAKMMPVPAITGTSDPAVLSRIADAFSKMLQRGVLGFLSERRLREMSYTARSKQEELGQLSDLSELDMEDRRELDDAVLQLMGVKKRKERAFLLDELYAYMREFFEWTRQKEEKAIVNKKKAKRRGPASATEVAQQIYKVIVDSEQGLLRQYDPGFIDMEKPFDTFEIPADGEPAAYSDMFVPHGVRFAKGKRRVGFVNTSIPEQDPLVVLLANSGVRGLTRVPHEQEECNDLLRRYGRFVKERDTRVRQLVELRIADQDMQDKIIETLLPMMIRRP